MSEAKAARHPSRRGFICREAYTRSTQRDYAGGADGADAAGLDPRPGGGIKAALPKANLCALLNQAGEEN